MDCKLFLYIIICIIIHLIIEVAELEITKMKKTVVLHSQ